MGSFRKTVDLFCRCLVYRHMYDRNVEGEDEKEERKRRRKLWQKEKEKEEENSFVKLVHVLHVRDVPLFCASTV